MIFFYRKKNKIIIYNLIFDYNYCFIKNKKKKFKFKLKKSKLFFKNNFLLF